MRTLAEYDAYNAMRRSYLRGRSSGCLDCGRPTSGPKAVRCRECWINRRAKQADRVDRTEAVSS